MEYSNQSNILKGIESIFEIEFKTNNEAEIVLKSIKPEINGSPSDRTSVNMNVHGNILKITVDAIDTPSFRASLNSYLRWIKLSYEVINLKKINK
ncbi:MAG: KEOPS complex subunit Pcc1 [Methanobacterium sp.]|nr:KEOPS complex subunit Pcc1 [Methanobacterium sp.]